MARVVVVEDKQDLRADLVDYLEAKGYDAVGVGTARDMVAMLETDRFDAVILDIQLPDGDGLDLLTRIRASRNQACGVVMLTVQGNPSYRVDALEQGADAYLVKRASLREIEATLRSVLRRVPAPSQSPGPNPHAGPPVWHLDRTQWRLVSPAGMVIALTGMEMLFLGALAECGRDICDRDRINLAMGKASNAGNRNLDAIIRKLRRKVESATGASLPVKMVYGMGYTSPKHWSPANEGRPAPTILAVGRRLGVDWGLPEMENAMIRCAGYALVLLLAGLALAPRAALAWSERSDLGTRYGGSAFADPDERVGRLAGRDEDGQPTRNSGSGLQTGDGSGWHFSVTQQNTPTGSAFGSMAGSAFGSTPGSRFWSDGRR